MSCAMISRPRWSLRAMTALLVLRDKAIKPLLAAAQPLRPTRGAHNPKPIDLHYDAIRCADSRAPPSARHSPSPERPPISERPENGISPQPARHLTPSPAMGSVSPGNYVPRNVGAGAVGPGLGSTRMRKRRMNSWVGSVMVLDLPNPPDRPSRRGRA